MLFRLLRFVRSRLHKTKPDFYGIFSRFDEIDDQNPWNKKPWVSGNILKLEKLQDGHFSTLAEGDIADQSHILLPALIINTASSKSQSVNILDFGGGTGFSYFPIKEYLINPENINWHVFDQNSELYSAGKNYVSQRSARGLKDNIEFLTEFPSLAIDIVHSASTIEYVEDDEGLLKFLVDKYEPKYFVLTRIKGGNIREFITRQVIGDFSTPCRFSNVPRLIKFFEKCGYKVLINGPCGVFVPANFSGDIPKEMQIRRSVDLAFERISNTH